MNYDFDIWRPHIVNASWLSSKSKTVPALPPCEISAKKSSCLKNQKKNFLSLKQSGIISFTTTITRVRDNLFFFNLRFISFGFIRCCLQQHSVVSLYKINLVSKQFQSEGKTKQGKNEQNSKKPTTKKERDNNQSVQSLTVNM